MNRMLRLPWRYAPQSDTDGFTIGVDHFVVDAAGEEVVLARDEATARLIAAAPDLLAACEEGYWLAIQEAIAKAHGMPTRFEIQNKTVNEKPSHAS